jgi:hypothetical protein
VIKAEKVPGVGLEQPVMDITLDASRGRNLSHSLLEGALPCLAVAMVEFSPSLVASDREKVASRAIVAFNYALAYDCSRKMLFPKRASVVLKHLQNGISLVNVCRTNWQESRDIFLQINSPLKLFTMCRMRRLLSLGPPNNAI